MIEFDNVIHGHLIAEAIACPYNPKCDHVISRVADDGVLLGGVIYKDYTGSSVFMHQAGFDKAWINRDMLWVCFDYPFNQLGYSVVFGAVSSTNPHAFDINRRLGFSVEAVLKDGYPDDDMLIMAMRKDQCRWLALKPQGIKSNTSVTSQGNTGE